MDIDTIRRIEALPNEYNGVAHRFTQDEDDILLKYWKKKKRGDIAKIMGLSVTTLKRRYRKIAGG